jgi:hypothetical protein
MNPPRVFISYSHDSAEHKEWVLELSTTLRNRGVDAILDQWDLRPGEDLPSFMEQNLAECDYAVMVCTRRYVDKANKGHGGVGYEKMIMTSQSLNKISESKVIPIIREQGDPAVPTFMSTRLYIDFSKDNEVEYSLDELLRTLLNAPLYQKPEIGKDPFKPLEASRPDRTVDGIKQLMIEIADAFDATTDKQLFYPTLVSKTQMRRLTFDKYLRICMEKGFMSRYAKNFIYLTEEGIKYLNEHDIVEA